MLQVFQRSIGLAFVLGLLLASTAYAYDGRNCRTPNHGGPIVCGPTTPDAPVVTCPDGFIVDPFRSDPLAPCLPIPDAPEQEPTAPESKPAPEQPSDKEVSR